MARRVRLKRKELAALLADSRLSQNAWALRLGLSKSYLSQLLRGTRRYPSPEVQRRLMETLDVPFERLFEVEPRRSADKPVETLIQVRTGRYEVRIDRLAVPGTQTRGETFMDRLWQDLRFGMRMIRRNPGFSASVVLLLALGLGANAAVYSLVHAVLIRPLPYPEAERLAALWENDLSDQVGKKSVSPANYLDWHEQAQAFSAMAAYHQNPVTVTGLGETREMQAGMVSPDFFRVLSVVPRLGRAFEEEDARAGGPNLVILSHHLWTSDFGADPKAVGRLLQVDGVPHEIIGVMPRETALTDGSDLWRPLIFDFDVAASRGAHYLGVIARLAPGRSWEEARSEMDLIASRLEAAYPDKNKGEGVTTLSLHEDRVGEVRPMLLILQSSVFLILLIACANVANLLVARTAVRRQEIVIRSALGAGSSQILRQLLTEALVLALAAGALGSVFSFALLRGLLALTPFDLPSSGPIEVNLKVLFFGLVVAALTGLLFGLAPAVHSAGFGKNLGFADRGPALPTGRRLHNALVVGELAVAVILVVAAGLLAQTFWRLTAVDPGFDSQGVLTLRLSLPEQSRYGQNASTRVFYEELQQRLSDLPGVTSAGAAAWLPLGGAWTFAFDIEGREPFPPGEKPSGVFRPIVGEYFKTMGIQLLQGRVFGPQDNAESPLAVIVDRELAERFFPDSNPVGQRLLIGYGAGEIQPREIVGVVSSVKQWGLSAPTPPGFYLPHSQVPFRSMHILVRTREDPMALLEPVKAQIWAMDDGLAVSRVQTLDERVFQSSASSRFRMALIGGFALCAVLLALFGIYAVVSHFVTTRVSEIGIRMALGAQRGDVMRLVLGRGLLLIGSGILLGLVASRAATELLSRFLFQVTPSDLGIYVAVGLAMVIIALLACYLPARRASRLDPLRVLRCE